MSKGAGSMPQVSTGKSKRRHNRKRLGYGPSKVALRRHGGVTNAPSAGWTIVQSACDQAGLQGSRIQLAAARTAVSQTDVVKVKVLGQPACDQPLRKAFGLFKKLGIKPVDGVEYQEAVRKDWD